jgi:hypothetical protein
LRLDGCGRADDDVGSRGLRPVSPSRPPSDHPTYAASPPASVTDDSSLLPRDAALERRWPTASIMSCSHAHGREVIDTQGVASGRIGAAAHIDIALISWST